MQSYRFTYLSEDGEVLGMLDAKCADDGAAVARGLAAKPPVATVMEIVCGKRPVVRQSLESGRSLH